MSLNLESAPLDSVLEELAIQLRVVVAARLAQTRHTLAGNLRAQIAFQRGRARSRVIDKAPPMLRIPFVPRSRRLVPRAPVGPVQTSGVRGHAPSSKIGPALIRTHRLPRTLLVSCLICFSFYSPFITPPPSLSLSSSFPFPPPHLLRAGDLQVSPGGWLCRS